MVHHGLDGLNSLLPPPILTKICTLSAGSEEADAEDDDRDRMLELGSVFLFVCLFVCGGSRRWNRETIEIAWLDERWRGYG